MDMSLCADCGVAVPWTIIAVACLAATAAFVAGRRLQAKSGTANRVAAGALYVVALSFLVFAFLV
jgi:hypothetical protein